MKSLSDYVNEALNVNEDKHQKAYEAALIEEFRGSKAYKKLIQYIDSAKLKFAYDQSLGFILYGKGSLRTKNDWQRVLGISVGSETDVYVKFNTFEYKFKQIVDTKTTYSVDDAILKLQELIKS